MRITSRGYTIDYTVDGAGPPLLLIAGTLCAAQHWRDYEYTAALRRRWRIINVDPLGHGASDVPHDADSYDAAGVTADLVAVLDAEGIARATVWGYSRGGWLACNLASRYPERVARVVVGAYAMNAHEAEAGRLLTPLTGFLRQANWSALWQALGVTDREFQRLLETSNDPLAVAAAIEGSLRPTRFIDPGSVRCPATYYVGSEDWILPHVQADVGALDATLDVIAGVGHIGSFFGAAEQVLTAVGARLER